MFGLTAPGQASGASSGNVRIQGLRNASFGTITSTTRDSRSNQNVCVYSSSTGSRYTVSATGSGSGGAFVLNSGNATLAYEVEWADTVGQTTGNSLSPNGVLAGLASRATKQNCAPTGTSASLIVVIRALTASGAAAGSYSGTLTVIIGPN